MAAKKTRSKVSAKGARNTAEKTGALNPLTPCPTWLLPHWHDLYRREQQGRLPHALLFTGMQGLGKRQFVRFVTESLLCLNASAERGACGECTACKQIEAGSHPEMMAVKPKADAKSEVISVDVIRDLVQWLQLSAPRQQYRIATIDKADDMQRSGANSLLKTLEEPGERQLLLLAAERAGSLPVTIRSRCQCVALTISDKNAAQFWLKQNGLQQAGELLEHTAVGPLQLLEQQTPEWQASEQLLRQAWLDLFLERASVGKIVDSLAALPVSRCLTNFSKWALLANKKHLNAPLGADPATTELVLKVHHCLSTEQWFTFYDRMQQLYRSDSASFKTQAVLEGLFADMRLTTKG